MAITEAIGGFYVPVQPQFASSGNVSQSGMVIDAAGEKVFFKITPPKSGEIDAIEFATGSGVGLQVTNGLKVSIQAVDDATGNPTGTILAYRVVTGITSFAWIVPGKMTSDGTDSGTPYTAVQGVSFCCVIEFNSFVTLDKVTIVMGVNNLPHRNVYYGFYDGSSWSKNSTSTPSLSLRYADGSFPGMSSWGGVYPIHQASGAGISTVSSTDEVGMRFSFPVPVLIGGISFHADMEADLEIRLFDSVSASNPFKTVTIDASHRCATTAGLFFAPFSPPIYVPANEDRIVSFYNGSSTVVTFSGYSVDNEIKLAINDGGSAWIEAKRDAGGPWTFTATRRLFISILVVGTDHEIGGQPSLGFEGVS